MLTTLLYACSYASVHTLYIHGLSSAAGSSLQLYQDIPDLSITRQDILVRYHKQISVKE